MLLCTCVVWLLLIRISRELFLVLLVSANFSLSQPILQNIILMPSYLVKGNYKRTRRLNLSVSLSCRCLEVLISDYRQYIFFLLSSLQKIRIEEGDKVKQRGSGPILTEEAYAINDALYYYKQVGASTNSTFLIRLFLIKLQP